MLSYTEILEIRNGILEERKETYKNHWRNYNKKSENLLNTHYLSLDGTIVTGHCHTDLYMRAFELNQHINNDCKRIINLGASPEDGHFLRDLQKKKFTTIAYNYDVATVKYLKAMGITAKNIDLDMLDSKTKDIAYKKELEKDLTARDLAGLTIPINIFCIRILQYLTNASINSLLPYLIEHAPLNSVFFILSHVTDECRLFLMPAPKQDQPYKDSDKTSLYLYKNDDKAELFYYFSKKKYVITAKELTKDNYAEIMSLFTIKSNSAEEKNILDFIIEDRSKKACETLLDITSKKGHSRSKIEAQKDAKDKFPPRFVSSFFAPRIDMDICVSKTYSRPNTHNNSTSINEILVVKKREVKI